MAAKRSDDRIHDRALAFAREHGLSVRAGSKWAKGSGLPHGQNVYTIAFPKGELVVEVTFGNSRRMPEWFVEASDSATSRVLWRDTSWEWDDVYGDADESEEVLEEEFARRLIGFLAAVLEHPVRLAEVVTRRPIIRLFGRRWPSGTRTELQLLIDGQWLAWGWILYPDKRPS